MAIYKSKQDRELILHKWRKINNQMMCVWNIQAKVKELEKEKNVTLRLPLLSAELLVPEAILLAFSLA